MLGVYIVPLEKAVMEKVNSHIHNNRTNLTIHKETVDIPSKNLQIKFIKSSYLTS